MIHFRTAFIVIVALAACDKDKHSKVDPAKADPPAVAEKTPATADKPADKPSLSAPEPAKPVTPPTVTKTNTLDLELVEQNGKFTLRDDSYELTFPARPSVEGSNQAAPGGINLKVATALAQKNDTEVYGFFMIPVPKGIPFDIEKGLNGSRDGALNNIHATLISEAQTNVGGLKGRKVLASTELQGTKLHIEMNLAFDVGHHTMVGMFTTSGGDAPTQANTDFAASFKVNPKGKAPPAGNGT